MNDKRWTEMSTDEQIPPWSSLVATPSTPEFSERARYVTEQVALWIANDSEYIEGAKERAHDPERLRAYLGSIIRRMPKGRAAWHVAQELAPNDWDRIDWKRVAEEISD